MHQCVLCNGSDGTYLTCTSYQLLDYYYCISCCFSPLTDCMLVLTDLDLRYLFHVLTTTNTLLLVTHACNNPE